MSPKRLTGAPGRMQRIRELIEIVDYSKSDGITAGKLQALLDLRHGVSEEIVSSYIKTAHESGLIQTDGVRWYSPVHFPRRTMRDFILETRIQPVEGSEKSETG